MRVNGVEFDPSRNPATLDTYTWDAAAAVQFVRDNQADLDALNEALTVKGCIDCARGKLGEARTKAIKFLASSLVMEDGTTHVMAVLPDAQRVFISTPSTPLEVIGDVSVSWGKVSISPVNTDSVMTYTKRIANQFGPVAAGTVSRLGVGNRQTVTCWPGIYQAMREIGGPGEILQNSAYRELAPMDFVLAPPSSEATYLPGHGSLNIGHTGSSIEGIWLAGVVTAIEQGFTVPYGADLDHIPVKGLDDESIARAKRLIECGRHFTFFTLDTSFLYKLESDDLSVRYGDAIEAGVRMYEYIKSLKRDEPFDYEFSLDEGPAITTSEEQDFVLRELTKRGVKVAFIAPNVGFEKRLDYRLPDGLAGLEARVRTMSENAAKYGSVLDFHSGSDKSSETYRTIAKACGGKIKLKVSGKLQLILSEVLADVDPEFFNFWYDWTLTTARGEAERGSEVARKYVGLVEERMAKEGADFKRSPKDLFFTDFSFAMVGTKDDTGKFLYRDRFYSLSPEVQAEYTRRIRDYVIKLAEDLGVE